MDHVILLKTCGKHKSKLCRHNWDILSILVTVQIDFFTLPTVSITKTTHHNRLKLFITVDIPYKQKFWQAEYFLFA